MHMKNLAKTKKQKPMHLKNLRSFIKFTYDIEFHKQDDHVIRRFASTRSPTRTISALNIKIKDLVSKGLHDQTLQIFKDELHSYGLHANISILPSIIKACSHAKSHHGLQLHCMALKSGSNSDQVVSNSLISLYAKLALVEAAGQVFDEMPERDTITWNCMINCYIQNGHLAKGLKVPKEMYFNGFILKAELIASIISLCARTRKFRLGREIHGLVVVDDRIGEAILPACAWLGDIEHGKEIHAYTFRHGFESDRHCSASLIHMYCKHGKALRPAKLIFERVCVKDVVMWSLIIGSYSQCGDSVKALKLFSQMRAEGFEPNSVTLLAVISACTSLPSLRIGCGVHSYVFKSALNSDIFIGNALINMYAKCGCLQDSHEIFKEMPSRDSVSWSTMIESYGLHGRGDKALQIFLVMQERGIEPDTIAFLSVLSACNHAGLVEEGKKVFKHMIEDNKLHLTLEHYACYINLLGRFGKLEDACEVVRSMPMKPSSRIWSSLVTACKVHGRLEKAESLALHLVRTEPENPANYTLLSIVHAAAGNWLGVEEVRRVMRVHKLRKCNGFSRI